MPTPAFRLTERQEQAQALLRGPAQHIFLYGGSRSGKTFQLTRAVVMRAMLASRSRHAILRFRYNAAKTSLLLDTIPRVFEVCFPSTKYSVEHTDGYLKLENGSEIWIGGLDDKERVEKVLGREFATIYLNECSQIPWPSRNIAMTRLAQNVRQDAEGAPDQRLALRMYYDANPPGRSHWTYRLFVQKVDPDTRKPLSDPDAYASMQINPASNVDNLPPEYMRTLQSLSPRLQRRFLAGEFSDNADNALFREEELDRWRVLDGKLPDMQRIVVAVDPSGSGDTDNADNDAIGIVVAGLGTDGNSYVLEDLTVKAGPATWGRLAVNAYERHEADAIVAEGNFGGEMVRHVIQTARPRTNVRLVHASRGKVVRAEPIAALVPDGKVRLVGYMPELEDELAGFTQNGYTGENSPNRADAMIWALAELFPAIVKPRRPQREEPAPRPRYAGGLGTSWLGA